ncbi:ankyrin repeat domain-containing protein [Kerstersia gyiorum]|uniref:ankyrin repeat domain-containing protein n=1 Tax=Kerstersia gyiorum TaxID=206506 RepID=UPI000A01ECC5|nr:ankyrin repeat domain-containing protein [Kerstersia gyiorum]
MRRHSAGVFPCPRRRPRFDGKKTGLAPLHWAASHGNLATAKALIAGGATPNVANSYGQTAAVLARAHRKWEIAQFLNAL